MPVFCGSRHALCLSDWDEGEERKGERGGGREGKGVVRRRGRKKKRREERRDKGERVGMAGERIRGSSESTECTVYKRQREKPTAKRKWHCDPTSSVCHGI